MVIPPKSRPRNFCVDFSGVQPRNPLWIRACIRSLLPSSDNSTPAAAVRLVKLYQVLMQRLGTGDVSAH